VSNPDRIGNSIGDRGFALLTTHRAAEPCRTGGMIVFMDLCQQSRNEDMTMRVKDVMTR
jgi:hypothetical protein